MKHACRTIFRSVFVDGRNSARISLIGLAIICAFFQCPVNGDVIFSNLIEPGDQFGPDAVGLGAIPVPGVFVFHAVPFTPQGHNYRLTSLELPLFWASSGPNAATVEVLSDAGGVPSSDILESFSLINLPFLNNPLLTIDSIAEPTLIAGEQYWIAATGGTPTSFIEWTLTLFQGDPSAGGAFRDIVNGQDQGWQVSNGARMGAMVVEGDISAIPEPSSFVLLAGGLLLIIRRRLSA
jgi:hypothetical protein